MRQAARHEHKWDRERERERERDRQACICIHTHTHTHRHALPAEPILTHLVVGEHIIICVCATHGAIPKGGPKWESTAAAFRFKTKSKSHAKP